MIVRTAPARRPSSVIPAKAGIHTAYPNKNARSRGALLDNVRIAVQGSLHLAESAVDRAGERNRILIRAAFALLAQRV